MANRKISDLTALTTPATGDLLPIVDISEAAAADKNKKITYGELLASAPLGSAAAPSIAFEGDNTGIYSPGADQLAISTNGTGRLFVDSSGRVGVGTGSPSGLIHGYINANAQLIFQNSSQNNLYVSGVNSTVVVDAIGSSFPGFILKVGGNVCGQFTTDGSITQITSGGAGTMPVVFLQSSTERLRIDSSGRLLVGTSTSRAVSSVAPAFQVEGTSFNTASMHLVINANDAQPSYLTFAKTRGTALGQNTVVQSGDNLGIIRFFGADGTTLVHGAGITAAVDGTPGANDMPGRLVFSTTANGASSPTEAMRINNQQELLIGTSTRNANGGVLQLKSGITFPATAVAASDANTLDDYEEGTWTPTIAGSTTVGTASYTTQTGTYTKIGRQVTVTLNVVYTGGTGAGSLRVSGLPFTPANGSFIGAVFLANIAATASNQVFCSIIEPNTRINITQFPEAGGAATDVAYDAAGQVQSSITYFV